MPDALGGEGMHCRITVMMVAFTVALSASSQDRDPVAAEALFRAGTNAALSGNYASACPRFAESFRLDPAVGTLISLSQCEARIGKLANAWEHYQRALGMLPPDDARVTRVRGRIGALEQMLPKLVVKLAPGAPGDTRVQRNGVELGASTLGLALPVNPDEEQTLVTIAHGHKPSKQFVVLKQGEVREVILTVGELDPTPVLSATPVASSLAASPMASSSSAAPVPQVPASTRGPTGASPQRKEHGGDSRTLGYVLGGVGLAGFATVVVTRAMLPGYRDKVNDHCDGGGLCDQDGVNAASKGNVLLGINTVGWVVGILGLGLGGYFVLAPSGTSAKASLAVGPLLHAGGGTVVAEGRF